MSTLTFTKLCNAEEKIRTTRSRTSYKPLYIETKAALNAQINETAFWKFRCYYPNATNVLSIIVSDQFPRYTLTLAVKNGSTLNPLTGEIISCRGERLIIPALSLFPDDGAEFVIGSFG